MLKEFLKKFLIINYTHDGLYEGLYADEYVDKKLRERIEDEYTKRYRRVATPFTNPELYDPLNPPEGYRYDPYYEVWIKL
jgi:hypothetical protein